jgi:uncharacterized protein
LQADTLAVEFKLANERQSRYKVIAVFRCNHSSIFKGRVNMAGKFELKKSKNDKFHFSLLAGNGQIILSSEMYESKASANNGIESVKKNAPDDSRYERMLSAKQEPYFVLKAGNHQVIGNSQMYASEKARDNGIESCKSNAPSAAVDDQT